MVQKSYTILWICGLILDTVVKTNRKDFEARLNMIQMMLSARKNDDKE
jgi:hypothetical protein